MTGSFSSTFSNNFLFGSWRSKAKRVKYIYDHGFKCLRLFSQVLYGQVPLRFCVKKIFIYASEKFAIHYFHFKVVLCGLIDEKCQFK